MTYIYALVDPVTERIRYIGKTVDPTKRLAKHIRGARNGWDHQNPHKVNWILSLLRRGQSPSMVILDDVTDTVADEAERAYIAFGRDTGWDLVNHTDGGTGGDFLAGATAETLERHRRGASNGGRVTASRGYGFAQLVQTQNRTPATCPKCGRVCGNVGALGYHVKACRSDEHVTV